jgi:hypothetical protein
MKYLLFIAILLTGMSAFAGPVIDAETGLLLLFTTEEDSAPSPVVLQGLGLSYPFFNGDGFFLDAGLFFSGTQYQYLNNRAYPADIERADTVWVFFAQLDARIGYTLPVSDKFAITVSAGPMLLVRIPVFAVDNGQQYMDDMLAFFYSNLRFLYAEGQLAFRWKINNTIAVSFKLRALFAATSIVEILQHSLFNNFQIQGIVGIEIPLGGEPEPAKP